MVVNVKGRSQFVREHGNITKRVIGDDFIKSHKNSNNFQVFSKGIRKDERTRLQTTQCNVQGDTSCIETQLMKGTQLT